MTAYPDRIDGPGVLARLFDGLRFRLRWATDGLREADWEYRASADAKSIGEIMDHIWALANWMCAYVLPDREDPDRPEAAEDLREGALSMFAGLREHIAGLDDAALGEITIHDQPFWHLINGPISDAIWHAGQIAYLRRAAGNPVVDGVNVFSME
jgi:hypothetical protein